MKEINRKDFWNAFWFGIHKPSTFPKFHGKRSVHNFLFYSDLSRNIWENYMRLPVEEYCKTKYVDEIKQFIKEGKEEDFFGMFELIIESCIKEITERPEERIFEISLDTVLSCIESGLENSDYKLDKFKIIRK